MLKWLGVVNLYLLSSLLLCLGVLLLPCVTFIYWGLGTSFFIALCFSSPYPTSYVADGAGVSTVSTVLVWIALAVIVCCLLATGFMCFLSSAPTPPPSRTQIVLEADPNCTHFPSLGRHGEQRLRGQHPGADHGHEPKRLLPPSVRRLPFLTPPKAVAVTSRDSSAVLVGG